MGYLDLAKAVEARLKEGSGAPPPQPVAPSVPTIRAVDRLTDSQKKPELSARSVDSDGAKPKTPVAPMSQVSPSPYSYPWPDALRGLGRRTIDAFAKCSACSRWSWVRYGGVVFCIRCAVRRAATDEAGNEAGET